MRLRKFLCFFCVSILLVTPSSVAQISPLQQISQKIEEKKGTWIAFQAKARLHFLTEVADQASCQADLFYHRLEEKILLVCRDESEELLMAFKSHDRDFEMYLPGQKTIFIGNIFDLEDSANIETHLRPLALYRALKPLSIIEARAQLHAWGSEGIAISLIGMDGNTPYKAREVFTTESGNVLQEIYFSPEGEVRTTIHRIDFKKHKRDKETDSLSNIIYPSEIQINTHEEARVLKIQFEEIHFYTSVDTNLWELPAPPDIPIAWVKEEKSHDTVGQPSHTTQEKLF